MKKNILALDMATKTGWAHSDGSSGVEDFAAKSRGESPGMKFVRLECFLDRMLREHPFEVLAYELPHHRGGHATQVLVGMQGIALKFAAANGIDHTGKRSGDIKGHATGKKRASKVAMMMAAEKKFGIEPETDDEADALWLLNLVQKELGY